MTAHKFACVLCFGVHFWGLIHCFCMLRPFEAGVNFFEFTASDFPAWSLQLLTITLGYGTLLLKRSPGFHKSTIHKHLLSGLETETKHLEWLII